MQQKNTYKLTGLFVLFGLLCFSLIIWQFVNKKFLTNDDNLVVMYFEESVSGLIVGSSVVFQGVEVGKVQKIRLMANLDTGTFKTPVYVTFNQTKALRVKRDSKDSRNMLDNLIAKGLRARLASANYLTGQLMIELLMDPNEPAVLRGSGKYPEIPTEFSSFAMLSKDLEDIPLSDILAQFSDILRDIDKNLPPIMQNMNDISTKINNFMDKKNNETTRTLQNINNTLEDISKASLSLKNLTDYLERHPEAIIQGKEK